MVRNKNKVTTVEEQLREFEAKLRREFLREKLESNQLVQNSFDTGSIPQIHVSIGALTASAQKASADMEAEYERVSGD